MKKIYFFAAMTWMVVAAQAQEVAATGDTYMAGQLATEDLNGTARYVGMGGAMDALGADISTIGTNPAGIGLFRKGQVSASLGMNSQVDGKSFADGSKTNASFDQIGVVFSSRTGKNSYMNFAFNYHKSRNFDYVLSAVDRLSTVNADGSRTYQGSQNSQTVFKDMNGLIQTNYSLPYSQVDNLYLNNMSFKDGEYDANGNFLGVYDVDYAVDYGFDRYEFDRAHTGYIGEYDFNLSGNVKNRFYWGLTIGINSVHYKGYSEYLETLDEDNPRPWFRDVLISDNHKISGYGYNVKAGVIFRPIEESPFRLGVSVATPTFYKLTTDNYTTIGTSVDYSAASEDFRFHTPWKFGVSAGHTIGTNVALGAVYEYTDYSTCDMRTIDGYTYDYWSGTDYEESSSDPVMKRHAEQSLKGVSTLKLGAEYKPSKDVALRIGYNYVAPAYQTNAMRDQALESPGVYYASSTDYTNWGDTNRLTLGAGFTFDKFRVDVAYQYQTREGDFYPFMKNYSASYDEYDANGNTTGNIVTMTNQCAPVKVKDSRHQLLCSLTYSF